MEVASCRNSVVPGVPVLSNRAVADPLSPTTGGLSRLPHESDPDQGGRGGRGSRVRLIRLLGPAFVAAVAYVDPGNVAANLTAGATFGYLLLWVLVAANAIAVIVQYLSAKLGLVTGRSLPQLLGDRLPRTGRILFWAQAELVVAATDVAEVIGGAIALQILFDLPLLLGGVIVAAVSLGLLAFQSQRSPRTFEFVTMGLLAIVALGFVAGLFVSPVDWGEAAQGLVPGFDGPESVLLAASMLGATVMPHAVYLHSSLVQGRRAAPPGESGGRPVGSSSSGTSVPRLLRATRWDVSLSLAVAGSVNIALLLIAAASLAGVAGTDSIEGASAAISQELGPAIGIAFGIGLLASGLASTSVGCYAGSEIMGGLLRVHVPVMVRRVVTVVPALVILALGVDPTWALVLSQVLLSIGIPFALVPLAWFTGRAEIMGEYTNRAQLRLAAAVAVVAVVALNGALVWLALAG